LIPDFPIDFFDFSKFVFFDCFFKKETFIETNPKSCWTPCTIFVSQSHHLGIIGPEFP
jgi:hypothetical protein